MVVSGTDWLGRRAVGTSALHAVRGQTRQSGQHVDYLAGDIARHRFLDVAMGRKVSSVCDDGYLAGFLTQNIIDSALRTYSAYTALSEVMIQDIQPLSPTTGLFDAQERLLQEGYDALPVATDDGKYLGLLTRENIADLHRTMRTHTNIIPGTQSA